MDAPHPASPSLPSSSIHRMNWHLVLIGIFLLLAGGAVAGILLSAGNSEPKPPAPPLTGNNAEPSTDSSAGGLPNGGTNSAQAGTLSNATIGVSPGVGWSYKLGKVSILLLSPGKAGLMNLISAPFKGTDIQLLQGIATDIQKAASQSKICVQVKPTRLTHGPSGHMVGICYAIVPQNGQASYLVDFAGAGTAHGDAFVQELITSLTSKPQQKRFFADAAAVDATIQWRLF